MMNWPALRSWAISGASTRNWNTAGDNCFLKRIFAIVGEIIEKSPAIRQGPFCKIMLQLGNWSDLKRKIPAFAGMTVCEARMAARVRSR
jgi:hypothetical protein